LLLDNDVGSREAPILKYTLAAVVKYKKSFMSEKWASSGFFIPSFKKDQIYKTHAIYEKKQKFAPGSSCISARKKYFAKETPDTQLNVIIFI